MYHYALSRELALVTGTFQETFFFMEINGASKMGTFTRQGPCFLAVVKENEIGTNVESPKSQGLCDLNNARFSRNGEPDKFEYGVESSKTRTENEKISFTGGWCAMRWGGHWLREDSSQRLKGCQI